MLPKRSVLHTKLFDSDDTRHCEIRAARVSTSPCHGLPFGSFVATNPPNNRHSLRATEHRHQKSRQSAESPSTHPQSTRPAPQQKPRSRFVKSVCPLGFRPTTILVSMKSPPFSTS